MRRGVAALLIGLLGSAAGLPWPVGAGAEERGGVTEVRHWSYQGYTRVVVELDRPAVPDLHRLAADPGADRPERLYVDLPGIWIGRRYAQPIPVGDGLLRDIRLGQNTLDRIRVVIDLEDYERHRLMVLRSPDRVVVDVFGSASAAPSGEQGGFSSARVPIERRPVRTVVLDPGHGGRDPGAIGWKGIQERDVTLRLAQRLEPRLERRGFRVVMTRSDDRSVSLEERTAIAEGLGGDLFVSLHANAAPRRGARGIETYYLDANHGRHALRVAAHENGIPSAQLDALQRTLARLRVSEVSHHSRLLARAVHEELVRGVRRRHRDVADLGVKQGPFYVLFLASMPAILVETGFVTNPDEARKLRSEAYLDELAEHIARGIDRYREEKTLMLAGAGG